MTIQQCNNYNKCNNYNSAIMKYRDVNKKKRGERVIGRKKKLFIDLL